MALIPGPFSGPTCGEFGGVKRGGRGRVGQPCGQPAGAGTDHFGTGRCHNHEPAVEKELAKKKARVVELLKGEPKLTTRSCASQAGIGPDTLFNWRKADPEFDAEVREALNVRDQVRAEMVEDAVFAQILAGKASAALPIWWSINRAPHRWRNVQEVRVKVDTREALAQLLGVPPQMLPDPLVSRATGRRGLLGPGEPEEAEPSDS